MVYFAGKRMSLAFSSEGFSLKYTMIRVLEILFTSLPVIVVETNSKVVCQIPIAMGDSNP